MTREWQPGDVALVIGDNIATPRIGIKDTHGWAVSNQKGDDAHARWVNDAHVEPIRSLVVIDPEDEDQRDRLLGLLIDNGWKPPHTNGLQAALRELANPTPPKPDEPTGLGAVVEDAAGTKWIRHDSTPIRRCWLNTDDCETRYQAWDEINAVRVLSEGVQP